jgi:broad specificity phosphatase PhoE
MSDLLFLRHAETAMAGTFCGHCDPPLNAAGKRQVRDLVARLRGWRIDAVCSSDLRRAVETAAPIAQALGLSWTTQSTLREIHFGAWEGLAWAEIEQRDPEYATRWMTAFPALPAPGGETVAAFESRVVAMVEQLLAAGHARRIAVVTHAGVMRVVLRTFLGRSDEQAWAETKPYCGWFELPGEPEVRIPHYESIPRGDPS